MKSMFSFAQGETPFYNPADAMFYLNDEERTTFDAWKKKGAPIGVLFFLIGLAIVVAAVATSTPAVG